MTAAGRPRCALLMDGAPSMAFTASPPNLSAKSPTITCVLRLSSSPTNTFLQKAGLDYTLESRDPLTRLLSSRWDGPRLFAGEVSFFSVSNPSTILFLVGDSEAIWGRGALDGPRLLHRAR